MGSRGILGYVQPGKRVWSDCSQEPEETAGTGGVGSSVHSLILGGTGGLLKLKVNKNAFQSKAHLPPAN